MHASMRMFMVATVMAVASGSSAYGASSGTFVWKGGEKGSWSDGDNWESDDADNPFPKSDHNYKAIVYINNSAVITNMAAIYFSELHVKEGCIVSVDTEGRMWAVANSEKEMVFDIGDDAELSICGKTSSTVYSTSSSGVFVKKGLGAMAMRCAIGTSGNQFKQIEVREGSLDVNNRSLRTVNGVEIFNDALLLASTLTMDGSTAVNIQEGGTAEISAFGAAKFSGNGLLVYTPSGTFSVANHLAGFSGRVEARGTAAIKASNPDFALLSSIGLADGTMFNLATNETGQIWSLSPALYGEGDVTFAQGPGTWTLGAMSLTSSTFKVSAGCNAPSLTFAGGVSTNLYLQLEQSNICVNITGGDYHFRRPLWGGDNRTYRQTGGNVKAVINDSENGVYSGLGNNEIFYTITGGTLTSIATSDDWSTSPRVGYGLGQGIDASGDAYVILRAARKDNGDANLQSAPTVGNKKKSILRVSGNAVVDVDALMMFSYWGGSATTGTVDLAGGILKVSKVLGFINNSSAIGKGSVGELVFRGGTLELGSAIASVPNYKCANPEEFMVYVGPDGGTVRTTASKYSQNVVFQPSAFKPYGSEIDGGLAKRGLGGMTITNSANSLVGPLAVYGSQMCIAGINGESAWRGDILASSANVVIDSNGTSASAATLGGASFAYAGGSALTVPADVGSVTIGSAGASGPSLEREGHGTLVVRFEKNDCVPGTDASLKVNGTIAKNPATGLLAAPVFAATYDTTVGAYMTNRNWMRLFFLECDEDGSLVAAEPQQGIPENSGGSTVVNVYSKSATLSADAHVGALSLTHTAQTESASEGPSLTIADGCTLTVGNGAGTIAPVLLNSVCMNSVDSGAKLLGGTIDFGEAEGVVMVNQSETKSNGHLGSSWTKLGSKIKGTGGVTFGSFNSALQFQFRRQIMVSGDNEYTGGTWIENVSTCITGASALGKDAVTIDGTETDGGQLVFDSGYDGGDFANDLVLNGNGVCVQLNTPVAGSDRAGAIKALSSAKLTGAVSLASDTSVSSFGGEGCTLEFAGCISGCGELTVKGDGIAKTRLSGINTYSGGTVVADGGWLCVANSGALGTGAVKVSDEGVLAFDNPLAASCANDIAGANVIVDLAGRTVETAPFVCTRPITNTVGSVKAKLCVTGGTSVYTGGDFGGNIQLDILPGATLDLGGNSVAVDYVRGAKRIVNGTLTVRVRDLGDFIGMTVIVR